MTLAGAVLAGGRGGRMAPDPKPAAVLAGRPLIARPLAALASVCDPVAVVCKRDTPLPPLPDGVERWQEPDEPRHPLTGIVYALERAGGPVLVCAADMPFVDDVACRALIDAFEVGGRCVVAEADGRLQPVLGVYDSEALDALRAAPADAALTATVEALSPVLVSFAAAVVASVDTPEDLAAAEAALSA